MSNFAIRAENVSKFYRIQRKQKYKMLRDRVQESISSSIRKIRTFSLKSKREPKENIISALDHVSFEIKHGESMGIIGANGAGKTTLLKILARVTAPSEGKVRMRGRVGSLLEVGTGFHTELSGRENVYLNGAVLGMRKKEIDRKFDEIVDFSGVEEFIDTPVKRYSSGMRMRLAFSVAAHLDTEILLVDEVLAVGDVAFQNKSLGKMEKVTHEGRTILFVSHNLAAVRSLCPTSIFLEHGKMQFMGDTETAMHMYLEGNQVRSNEEAIIQSSKRAQILGLSSCDAKGKSLQIFPHDKPVHVRIKVYLSVTSFKSNLALNIYGSSLEKLLVTHDFGSNGNSLIPTKAGIYEFQIQIPGNFLTPGKYYLGAQLSRQSQNGRYRPIHKLDHNTEFEIYDNGSFLSRINIPWQGQVHNPKIQWTRIDL